MQPAAAVPAVRVRLANARPLAPRARYVLYWMAAARRTRANFALQRALELARELDKPLLVVEALRCGYRWASARHHRFALDGMADNARALRAAGVAQLCYVEPEPGAGRGLLAALAEHACALVSDDWPCFFLPRALAALAARSPVRVEAVDANGLWPLAAPAPLCQRAVDFRRVLQRGLRAELERAPLLEPLELARARTPAAIPPAVLARWPAASAALLEGEPGALARLPLDASVGSVEAPGGSEAARACLARFAAGDLARYAEQRSDPDAAAASGLSPYLHWGQIGAHEVLAALAAREGWTPARMKAGASGRKDGWWGLEANSEAFLDELVTWRELALHTAARVPDFEHYESLPPWARATLEAHAGDAREPCYELADFEGARTHDALWNAAQTELVRTGRMHNYLRMLWGKKVLQWSASPRRALEVLIELNNKYALDGRDPNSYAGISWCLGRYDRPWPPERPIFGQIRYMSSENTARKLSVKGYLARFAPRAAAPRQTELFERGAGA